MKKQTYVIRVTITDMLYKDYIVEAENIFFAKIMARNGFFKDFPGANKNIKLSLLNPDTEKIREMIQIIESEG